jgi:tetratricopeptide (TPR) repeat protein
MGGVGKTQTALEYVYTNRVFYNRIYWITAIDQESLFSGYQKIAKITGLKIFSDLNPIETAEAVLAWLSNERSWLIIIDNLDDINVASRKNLGDVNALQKFLPPTAPHQHTLITTRNPHAAGIPAEGMEVPFLNREESIDLLSTLSKITIIRDSPESEQANEIVKELGDLSLGIEQAAVYVREAAGDFQNFLKRYEENRRDLHRWLPQGIRPYPYSIATIWSMSFNIVRNNNPQAAKLFRLLSFLNPDNILIDFLQSGAVIFENDLRQIILNQISMDNALIELEKFSLLKWNRLSRTILIHRLVQMVIKDEISDADSMTLRHTIINLCDQSFPREWANDNRDLCRICIDQIMCPLSDLEVIRTEKSADVMYRVGWFLRDDGKISDSERLSLQAVEIRTEILSDDHPSTLSAIDNLAMTYWAQGRTGDAARLQEELLAKRKRILGDDHPDTLTTMNNLALTYRAQGRTGDAARLQEEVLAKSKRTLGDDHPNTLTTMNNLAETYRAQGRTGDAARLDEEVLAKKNE